MPVSYDKWTPSNMDPGCGKWTSRMKYVPWVHFPERKMDPKNKCVELTCTVFPPPPLGSAENDSEMQNSGSVDMC